MESYTSGSGAVSPLSCGPMVGLPSHPADTLVMDAQLMQLLSVLQQGDTGLPATGSTLDTLVNAEEMIDAGIQHLMAWKAQQQLENNRRQLLQQLKALDLVGAALAGAGTSAGPEQCDQGKCLADALSVSQVPSAYSKDLCDQTFLTSIVSGSNQVLPQPAGGQAAAGVVESHRRNCTSFDMGYLQQHATNNGDLGFISRLWELQSLSNSDTLPFPPTCPASAFPCSQGEMPTQPTARQATSTLSAELSPALGLLPVQESDSSALLMHGFMGLGHEHVLDHGQNLQQQSCSVNHTATPPSLGLLPPASCLQTDAVTSMPVGPVLTPQLSASALPGMVPAGPICRPRRHSFHTTSRPHHAYKRVITAPVWPTTPARSQPLQQVVSAGSPFATAACHVEVPSMTCEHSASPFWTGTAVPGLRCTHPAASPEARQQVQGSLTAAEQMVAWNGISFNMHTLGVDCHPKDCTAQSALSAPLGPAVHPSASHSCSPARSSAPPPSLSPQSSSRFNGQEIPQSHTRMLHGGFGHQTCQNRCLAPGAGTLPRNGSASQLCGRNSAGDLGSPVASTGPGAAPPSKKGTGVFLPHKLIIDASTTRNGSGTHEQ